MPSPSKKERDFITGYLLDRMASLNAQATLACREPTCGARDEDNELVSCASDNCGEKLMLHGHRRELWYHRIVRSWVEQFDREEMAAVAAADRRGKR